MIFWFVMGRRIKFSLPFLSKERKCIMKKKIKQSKPNVSLRQKRDNDEIYQSLIEDYKKLYEDFSMAEEKIKESEGEYEKIYREYTKALGKIETAQEGERIEKRLKNESYAFILSEGLLDKFLDFREHFHRTRAQDAFYKLVSEAELGGLWIDIDI